MPIIKRRKNTSRKYIESETKYIFIYHLHLKFMISADLLAQFFPLVSLCSYYSLLFLPFTLYIFRSCCPLSSCKVPAVCVRDPSFQILLPSDGSCHTDGQSPVQLEQVAATQSFQAPIRQLKHSNLSQSLSLHTK